MFISGTSMEPQANVAESSIFSRLSTCKDPLIEKITQFVSTIFAAISNLFNWAYASIFSGSIEEQTTLDVKDVEKLSIDSSVYFDIDPKFQKREDFLNPKNNYKSDPPYIFASHFVPKALAEGLMREKSDAAIGVKYRQGTSITNMEALLHSFVVPMCKIKALGDYKYVGHHTMERPAGNGHTAKEMIMSATIQPDFETDEVMMKLVEISSDESKGEEMSYDSFPTKGEKNSEAFRKIYDEKLLKHAIYHLTTDSKRVSKVESDIFSTKVDAITYLESAIKQKDFDASDLTKKAFKVTVHGEEKVISLDILYHFYKEQLVNEFEFLDNCLESKYTYTLGPPSIFATTLAEDENVPSGAYSESVQILQRLQAIAFKDLIASRDGFSSNMAAMGVEDFADDSLVGLYQCVFAETSVQVDSRHNILNAPLGVQKVLDNDGNATTFVDHNCFDGFGQNIETEGDFGSKDGTYGVNTDAAHVLQRNRSDLMSQFFVTRS